MDQTLEDMRPLKRLLTGLGLLIISIILKYLVTVLSIIFNPIYYLLTLKWKSGAYALGDWMYQTALANDQTGNVIGGEIFRILFTKRQKNSHPFSDEDDTVSYVLARNKYKLNLNFIGRGMAWVLDKIDPSDGGHMSKAIHSKIESDEEAVLRMNENKYFE
jgi:hypothetical protein